MNNCLKPLLSASFTMLGLAVIASCGSTTNSLRFHGSSASATLNMDPARIEAAITPQTTAILPMHCYGYPFEVEAIQKIADNFNLKVIYDAAYAFSVDDDATSILRHGELSVLSFRATKVFNTFEGAAIVCADARTKQRIDQLKNVGFVDEVTVVVSGINGKTSEINVAFGILQLKHINHALDCRREIDTRYHRLLKDINGIRCVESSQETTADYFYFLIFVEPGYRMSRNALYEELKRHNINSRRYFYLLITDFPIYRGFSPMARTNLPVATAIANKVLCLLIYPDQAHDTINVIGDIIATAALHKDRAGQPQDLAASG